MGDRPIDTGVSHAYLPVNGERTFLKHIHDKYYGRRKYRQRVKQEEEKQLLLFEPEDNAYRRRGLV